MRPYLIYTKEFLLLASVATLPMFLKLNNILLGLFVFVSLIHLIYQRNSSKFRRLVFLGWPIYSFFILALIGAFYSPGWDSFKYLERYLSLLFLPLILIADSSLYEQRLKSIQNALLLGTLATLLICYVNVVFEMNMKNEPISYFFRWRHLGHQFTGIADTHPTYLGLFLVISQFLILRTPNIAVGLRIGLFLFFTAGLFQLASRMALILFIALFLGLIVHRLRKRKLPMLVLAAGLTFCAVTYINYGSEYLKNRLFSKESFLNDKRFKRWEVSYELFKEKPLFGHGLKEIESVRHNKYMEFGYTDAARENLNAHNQFLEYLVRNGAIGAFVYVMAMAYLFLKAIHRQDLFFSFVFGLFIIAGLTESLMVRIVGIEFLAIFGSLFLSKSTTHSAIRVE